MGGSSNLNGEARIIKDLLENYSVDARPVLNDSSVVNLRLDLELNQVIDIVSSTNFNTRTVEISTNDCFIILKISLFSNRMISSATNEKITNHNKRKSTEMILRNNFMFFLIIFINCTSINYMMPG